MRCYFLSPNIAKRPAFVVDVATSAEWAVVGSFIAEICG